MRKAARKASPGFWSGDPSRETMLRGMRAAGSTYSAIAVVLGCTKNAAIGRARRIGLLREEEIPLPQVRVGPYDDLGPRDCLWPLGDPGDPGFRFCAAPTIPDRPYCPEHAARAYARVPVRVIEASR